MVNESRFKNGKKAIDIIIPELKQRNRFAHFMSLDEDKFQAVTQDDLFGHTDAIMTMGTTKIYNYQFKSRWDNNTQHNDVCIELIAFRGATNNNLPIVGAHKYYSSAAQDSFWVYPNFKNMDIISIYLHQTNQIISLHRLYLDLLFKDEDFWEKGTIMIDKYKNRQTGRDDAFLFFIDAKVLYREYMDAVSYDCFGVRFIWDKIDEINKLESA